MKKYLPYLSISLAVLIWSSTFIVTKTALNNMAPGFLIFIRSLIGAFVLFFFCIKRLKKIDKKLLILNIFTGFMVAAGYLCQTAGLQYTSSAMSSFLETVYLIIVPFISWALTKRRPSLVSFISAFLAILGVVLISISSGAFSSPSQAVGVVLSILGGAFFGVNIAFTGDLRKDKDPIVYTFIQLLVIMVTALLYTLIFERKWPTYEPYSLLSAFYLGIFATGLAWLFRNYAQNYISPLSVSLILPFISVLAMTISLILGESKVDIYFIFGAMILFTAVFLQGIVSLIQKKIKNKQVSTRKS